MSQRGLTLAEGALSLLGATCLLVYGLSHWQTARAQASAVTQLESEWGVGAPDQSLWSEKRVTEYKDASLQSSAENALALLTIDRLGIEVAVFNGTSDSTLNKGAGRVPGTAQVGATGNLAIAAHRDGFFRGLKDIAIGDEIDVRHADGVDHFVVTSTRIVLPDDVSVLQATTTSSITLITCYPFYFVGDAPQRFIVKGKRKSEIETPTLIGAIEK